MQDQAVQLERRGGEWAAGQHDDTATLGRILAEDFVAVGPCCSMLTKEDGEVRHGDQFRATLVLAEEQGRWLLSGPHPSPIAGPPTQDSNRPKDRA